MSTEKKQSKIIWPIVLVLVAISIIVYFIIKYLKKPNVVDINSGKDIEITGYIPSGDFVDIERVFSIGDRGNSVKEFQRILNIKVSSKNPSLIPVQVDGVYGNETNNRLKNFTNYYLSAEKKNNSIKNLNKF